MTDTHKQAKVGIIDPKKKIQTLNIFGKQRNGWKLPKIGDFFQETVKYDVETERNGQTIVNNL